MPIRIDGRESPLRVDGVDAPDGWCVGVPDDLAGHGEALVAEARVHGAVAGMASDLDDEPVCWAFVVLRVESPWLVVDREAGPCGIAPESSRADDHWYVALWPSDEGEIHVPAAETITVDDDGWSSERWRIRPHPLTRLRGRDWRWRDGGSGGPHSLTIRSSASVADLTDLLERCAPLPYTRDDTGRYVGPEYVGEAPRVQLSEGRLVLLRGYTDPRDHVRAVDTGLALMIADGALGDITWLIWEHDWESPVALGDDGESLRRYLTDPEIVAIDVEQAALVKPFIIDATGTSNDDTIAATIERALAAKTQPSRHAVLRIDVPPTAWSKRVRVLHPRMIWRVEGRDPAVAPASD